MQTHLLLCTALWLGIQPIRAAEIRHRFLAKDESRAQLLLVDQYDPSKNWTIKLTGKGRDLQLTGKNVILLSSPDGYWEYDLTDRKLLKEVKGYPGTMSARRQPDGHTLLACAQKEVTVYELSATDQVLRKVIFPVPTTRVIRQTPQNTILFGCKSQFFEGDLSGKILKTFTLPAGSWVYQALREPNGHWLVSGGYNPTLFELDPEGNILNTIGGKENPEAKVHGYNFFGAMQRLRNGDIVVCNWTGHGANDSAKGAQLLQFDKSGRVVWKWHDSMLAGSIHGVIILDDLDPTVLNDDVTSVLGPMR
ncbi:MAG: hypothetical protein WCO56_21595 [Verrucomicrobiota bacterium]